jgi:hypothetical protein
LAHAQIPHLRLKFELHLPTVVAWARP